MRHRVATYCFLNPGRDATAQHICSHADRIFVHLKVKRRPLSAECLNALSPKAKKRRAP